MPQLVEPHGALGMVAMRLGDEVEARRVLERSFEIDPFNVRVSNSLKVLEVLEGYAVIETEHFILKFDRGQDEILARYVAAYLEDEVYPELTARFGFAPARKSLFEIFSKARNTSGHGWFSARMVGLPYVGTVGACAGQMVALASPNDMPQKYSWARVLKHEFVHVLNLQQTDFNIPHWFTEALAVESEGLPRPQTWNELLAVRVPKGELFNLDTINLGFIRPASSLDWQMAYCQAQLYAQYMIATWGGDAVAKLLEAYADNLDTPAALARSFQVDVATFESGYRDFVAQVAGELRAGPPQAAATLSELERAFDADPENADLAAQLALAWFNRRQYAKAREFADQARAIVPKHQLAAFVLARIKMVVGEHDEAVDLLEEAMDPDNPDERTLGLLAELKHKARQWEEAARLYEQAAAMAANPAAWLGRLVDVYGASRQAAPLEATLARLAELDADDVAVRKRLASACLARGDFTAAADWSRRANQIDVMDVEIHRTWAEAARSLTDFAVAARELEITLILAPDSTAERKALAEAYLQLGQTDKARAALEALIEIAPDFPGAKELLAELSP
jgi:tetratricopeptide (TPR) repeat protein